MNIDKTLALGAQRRGQVGLADADGTQYRSPVGGFDEPQADQLVLELLVAVDGGCGVPGVQPYVGFEPCGADVAGRPSRSSGS